MSNATPTAPVIPLTAQDLTPQGVVVCPSPRTGMPQWASHPRIYLHLDETGQVQCPYCNHTYQLVGGAAPAGH